MSRQIIPGPVPPVVRFIGGALVVQAPDDTPTGGNGRGEGAVDLQFQREEPDEVASGPASSLGGGIGNQVSGFVASVGGGAFNDADGFGACIPGGIGAKDRGIDGRLVFASYGSFDEDVEGQAQWGLLVVRCETTDAAAKTMTVDGGAPNASNIYVLPEKSLVHLRVDLVGRDVSTGDAYAKSFSAVYKRGVGAAINTVVGAGHPVPLEWKDAGANAWTAGTPTFYGGFGGIGFGVKGEAGKTIRWVATIYTIELVA